ncbi:hypothetical protein SteCoe_36876 [Stentor coeruleus]|uniref:Calcium-dependent protein kinase 1 n=1 Tax=Stentor coeruleus TaxID=5963 RepID=A0A1R2AP60_9CILI|nr:hypothetical protein SteCoe_36876 [Stentor coeruleus]
MGCSSSKNTRNMVVKPRFLETQTPIDSPDKLPIRPGTFIFHKTSSLMKDYELGPILGQGAYGSVRTAVHKLTNQERAIKTVKKDKLTKDMQAHSKFFAEIDILRRIDHPNILKLFEFYEDNKSYHLVTEIIKGGELFDYIVGTGNITENIAMGFMKQILFAVNYCHKLGIVHRDLKPENLLLERKSSDGNLKVIDFGASTLFEGDKVLKNKYGTSYYIAPEVLKRSYNEKCDIWSCGVIMFVLLSGRPPFTGKNDEEIFEKIAKGSFSLMSQEWANVSEVAKDLLKKMLEYNPDLRYSAEQALNDPWFKTSPPQSPKSLPSIINNMKSFHASEKLQHAVLTFITSQLSSKEETKNLGDIFKSIDTNGDGKLSRDELFQEFRKTMSYEEAEDEVNRILNCVDMDMNGFIDYSEFLISTMKKESLISKKNLETAFKMFDKDGSGYISASELKSILGENVKSPNNVWMEIISKVDKDGDGEISVAEFKDMMMKIFADSA